jgi:hypothetical protein
MGRVFHATWRTRLIASRNGLLFLTFGLMWSPTTASCAQRVTVPGTAAIHLAGQPNGTALGGDSKPQDAPVEIKGLQAGQHVTITATGFTCNDGPDSGCGTFPGGGGGAGGVGGDSDFGLSPIAGFPINALVGVFLGPMRPNPTVTPPALNEGQGYSSETPVLQQVFFIGAGPRTFTVPEGATQLFLGSTDTPGTNYNNGGSFAVTIEVIGFAGSFRESIAPFLAPVMGVVSVGILVAIAEVWKRRPDGNWQRRLRRRGFAVRVEGEIRCGPGLDYRADLRGGGDGNSGRNPWDR